MLFKGKPLFVCCTNATGPDLWIEAQSVRAMSGDYAWKAEQYKQLKKELEVAYESDPVVEDMLISARLENAVNCDEIWFQAEEVEYA